MNRNGALLDSTVVYNSSSVINSPVQELEKGSDSAGGGYSNLKPSYLNGKNSFMGTLHVKQRNEP